MSLEVEIFRRWKGFTLDTAFRSPGGVLGILGASGCGKSMTLKSIAGVVTPHRGRIAVGQNVLFDSAEKTNQKPQLRKTGYLFQNYALFPNMTVEANIGCALPGQLKHNRGPIAEMLERMRLFGLERRYPHQLSGGQQQRVALARILVGKPAVLLLDEPFSALDAYLRERLQLELLELLAEYGGDTVLVTHNRDEVYRIADRLVVMENGRSIACGPTKELFRRPGLLSVARLTGCKNFSRARRIDDTTVQALDWDLSFRVPGPVPQEINHLGVRAHNFVPAQSGEDPNRFLVSIRERLESPFEWNVVFTKTGAENGPGIWWKFSKEHDAAPLPAYLTVRPEDVLLLRGNEAQPKPEGQVDTDETY